MHLDVCNLFVCWWVWIGLSPWCNLFCMSHVHAFHMHTFSTFQYTCYIWTVLELFWLFLSLPLFLFTLVVSMAPKRKSTPTWNPLHSSASSSSDSAPLSSVPWWWCPQGILGELFYTRCSFGMPSHTGELRRHWPSHFYSQSRMEVTVWHLGHLSFHAHLGFLLQPARDWSFSTSLLYSRSRYAYSYHTATCCRCASGS